LFSGFNVALADACERAQARASLLVEEIDEEDLLPGAFVETEERADLAVDSLVRH
jgi:hypothetical protein